jgi:hypothetical protein
MRVLNINPASLTYRFTLQVGGAHCALQTNSRHLESVMDRWSASNPGGEPEFHMQVFVTRNLNKPCQSPHFRGRHHLVIATFGGENVFLFDLRRRNVSATVCEAVANDKHFWNEILLPIAIGVLGASIGTVPVHCACLASDEGGLLVAGTSGAGKSTLSAAMAQSGFDYVSDDWTYISTTGEELNAHGMGARIKLLPDTVSHFPGLRQHRVNPSMNGELAYEVMAEEFGARVRHRCQPRWGVFLERSLQAGCDFMPLSMQRALHYLESSVERLPTQLSDVAQVRARIMNQIAALPWFSFRYGGTPQFAARQLREFVAQQRELASL